MKQFGGGVYGGSDNVVTDQIELQLYQRLEKLYISTRAGKVSCFFLLREFSIFILIYLHSPSLIMVSLYFQHYQRDIVRGVEGYIVTGSKQVEIGRSCWLLKLLLNFVAVRLQKIIVFSFEFLYILFCRNKVVRR